MDGFGESVDKNLLLTTVTHLDPKGCILKLLCKLETKSLDALTPEEAMVAHMFNTSESLTPSNAAFVYAAEMGSHSKDAASCDQAFSECTLDEQELRGLFQRSWSCDMQSNLE